MKKRMVIVMVAAVLLIAGWCLYASFTSNSRNAQTLGEIPAPWGYARVDATSGSYADFLRHLPLKPRGARVHRYTGETSFMSLFSSGVIDYKMLSNSEQCADVAMRLRAEYLWANGRYSEICFRNVNGQNMRYQGGKSRKEFEQYLRKVYGLCSTFSMYRETKTRAIKDIKPGDVLVYPAKYGLPYGHAVLVADVATNGNGKYAIMCVEGSTPAIEAHIIRNLNPLKNPWFFIEEDDDHIWVSLLPFQKEELRHY